MRIRQVDAIMNGDILAEPVLNDKKNVIIPSGTALKTEYIPLIHSLGIDTLMIDDPYEDYENSHTIIPEVAFHNYVARVRELMERHIYHDGASLHEFEIIAHELMKDTHDIEPEMLMDIKERPADLYEHTVMVTILSLVIAKRLGLDKTKRYNIAIGCLLHDIGLRYVTVPYTNRNLISGDPISVFEFKKHTILGYSAMEDEAWVPNISRKMILNHHENAEGSGFPMRQKCKEIECKIIQVCDVFDSAICGMERERISVRDALQLIESGAGTLFDEKIVELMVSLIAKYPTGTTVVTNGEKSGVVVEQTTNADKPVIMVLDVENPSILTDKLNLLEAMGISILQVV